VSPEGSVAFAPGRVNLIGEHTDYNEGLALPFAISEGVTVRARLRPPGSDAGQRVEAHAVELGERDEFDLADPPPAEGWRAFVRGTVAELGRAGFPLAPSQLEITGDVPLGAGLSSSAALEVALALAMIDLGARGASSPPRTDPERLELAQLCARVESDWVGARTGLLDQLASIFGDPDTALCIDFRTLEVQRVRLKLGGWRLAVLDSGERHSHATSGYNERRAECAAACELLGIRSLREADPGAVQGLPEPLRMRARHVLSENERVRQTVAALSADDLHAVGRLLNSSHASLRDFYAVSTPTVEAAVERLLEAGAAGARLTGGGFGGSVLGLFEPGVELPEGARDVRPGPGAHLVEDR
jgi:galactokinase